MIPENAGATKEVPPSVLKKRVLGFVKSQPEFVPESQKTSE
jgi:hypothetical protein